MSTEPGIAQRYAKISDPDVLEQMRRGFTGMNRRMLLVWKLGLGWAAGIWPAGLGRLMVIEHVGRKSGKPYRTPVNFTRCGPDVYCIAGFGPGTDWYRNLLANPRIAIWLPDGRWKADAVEVSDSPDRLHLVRRVLIDSGFASRAVGIDPHVADDEALDGATATYRLLRITPDGREDAPDGPGSLAWVWRPLGIAFALGWWLGRRR